MTRDEAKQAVINYRNKIKREVTDTIPVRISDLYELLDMVENLDKTAKQAGIYNVISTDICAALQELDKA